MTRPSGTVAASYLLQGLGQAIVEEVEGLFSKAESYFGRRVTSFALAVIGLGAIAAAFHSIATNVLMPVWGVYSSTKISLALVGTATALVMAVGSSTLFVMDIKSHGEAADRARRAEETLVRAEAAFARLEEERENARSDFREAVDRLAAANLMLEELT